MKLKGKRNAMGSREHAPGTSWVIKGRIVQKSAMTFVQSVGGHAGETTKTGTSAANRIRV